MDEHIKTLASALWHEIKKDAPFFGGCGLVVGWLMIVQFRLRAAGAAPKDSWADTLFSDFVSFNAFGLVFVGLLGLGALVTCLRAMKINWPSLEASVAHLEARLAQLASSIISFTLGLSLFAVLHAMATTTGQGVALALVVVLFDGLIVVGFVSAALISRRPHPFDRWYVGLGMLAAAIASVTYFVLHGAK